jgi:hypothetical protein
MPATYQWKVKMFDLMIHIRGSKCCYIICRLSSLKWHVIHTMEAMDLSSSSFFFFFFFFFFINELYFFWLSYFVAKLMVSSILLANRW